MNKKQLIVAWATGILICGILIFGDYPNRITYIRVDSLIIELLTAIISILIIGGLLIYSLKDKKK